MPCSSKTARPKVVSECLPLAYNSNTRWRIGDLDSSTAHFEELAERPYQISMAWLAANCLRAVKKRNKLPDHEWDQFLEEMKRELPYRMRPVARAEIKDLVKEFPKRPSTGRNRVLRPQEEKEACDLVSKYHRRGESMRSAYDKVGKHFDCSG